MSMYVCICIYVCVWGGGGVRRAIKQSVVKMLKKFFTYKVYFPTFYMHISLHHQIQLCLPGHGVYSGRAIIS